MVKVSSSTWDDFLGGWPDAHLLQTSAWGALKQEFGWGVDHVLGGQNLLGAQILFKSMLFGYRLAYIPKGPVGWQAESAGGEASWQGFLPAVDEICRQRRAVLLIMEPDFGENQITCEPAGFSPGLQTIQPRRTLLVDLTGGESAVLGRMKQKTRYNIRLAQKKGVISQPSQDIETFYQLMMATAQRDAFGVHTLGYYQKAYQIFRPLGECELFIAEYEGEPLAGLMVFAHGSRAWYLYGASTEQHRELMPTYLVQWEAMRWAIQRGCSTYDLWGVPDDDEADLEANFTQRADGLWGVYRFKRGFGGILRRSAGSYERVYNPALYAIYHWRLRLRNRAPV
jgi:lipid II:glycine glycyltransferase (peptidoglycan interpeptide bridge formation enzyme)